jgi:hypothetical protein
MGGIGLEPIASYVFARFEADPFFLLIQSSPVTEYGIQNIFASLLLKQWCNNSNRKIEPAKLAGPNI